MLRSTITAYATATTLALASIAFSSPSIADVKSAARLAETAEKTAAADQAIEQFMKIIRNGKKPLPAWAVDLATKFYSAWKTYKNGARVDEIEKEVIAVLRLIAEIRAQVEAGRELSEREYHLTRELLDAHGRRLDDLTVRLEIIEQNARSNALAIKILDQRSRELEQQAVEQERHQRRLREKFERPGCGKGFDWRGGRCTDVASNPR